jgi:spore maturation protein CgeB
MMRILLCPPPGTFSVGDVARGYLHALRRAGCDVREYPTFDRLRCHRQALGEEYERVVWKQACEGILQEAIYHHADLVLFVCGLSFHPIALELLRWAKIPAAVIHTESPYQDDEQIAWTAHYPGMLVCTHESYSAERYGWTYLPHAYDPDVHRPVESDPAEACDVLMVGYGWPERQALLESVDWTGINLRLRGWWPGITEGTPLWPYFVDGIVPNADLPRLYASAKINLNIHRGHPNAKSLNPRAYELAACGVFQMSDRLEASAFGRTIAVGRALPFKDYVRYWLDHDEQRRTYAEVQQQTVRGETFDARVKTLLFAARPAFTDAALRLDDVLVGRRS